MKITRTSPVTGKINTLDLAITTEQLDKLLKGGYIQEILPHLSADEREFIISGIYPGEWDEIFSPLDEDDEIDDGPPPEYHGDNW